LSPPDTIIISQQLFWNLRANGFYVAWLSFFELENDLNSVASWLESDSGGLFYWMSNGSNIVLSSSQKDFTRLQVVFGKLQALQKQNYPLWNVLHHNDLMLYDYIRPSILDERILVVKERSKYSFVPKLPEEYSKYSSGIYTVTVKWNEFLLPQNNKIVQDKVSSETIYGFVLSKNGQRDPNTRVLLHQDVLIPRFRITFQHYLKVQISSQEPLDFAKPSSKEVVEILFNLAGFSYVEQSSNARYHTIFINRCGNLENAAYYLATPPYRELFKILSDGSDTNKIGWILDYPPPKRRAVHYLDLRNILQKVTPSATEDYFKTASSKLPDEVFQLLEKGLLERGFSLSCSVCSYRSWYPAERVGQTFECARCFQTQIYNSNPLWLYKLPEVIFQGFNHHMEVPLLALNYLKNTSKHTFEWVPDSDVYMQTGDNKSYRNLDILCIVDGKFYIGEAKSNDEIEARQFSFYEEVCKRVAIDGVVFATSQSRWDKGTQQRIDSLKTWYKGEVLVLTENELYPNTNSITQ